MANSVVGIIVKRIIRLPSKMRSHEEFQNAIIEIKHTLTPSTLTSQEKERLTCSAYYVLGWLVGDAGKHFGRERLMSARISLELTRKHPENLKLGEYVIDCIRNLGISCTRRPDQQPREREPHGVFWWQSVYSSVIGWLHVACLGLKWHERTTRNAVRMNWLFSAPSRFRIWFLRGLADSDGGVHFKDKCVDITTLPNTVFVRALFRSLGIHTRIGYSHGCSYVVVSATEAARIRIFNPEIVTHRRKILERLVNAKTFQRRWPIWLEQKVQSLLREDLGIREISDKLLEEDNVYVKMNTVKRKSLALKR